MKKITLIAIATFLIQGNIFSQTEVNQKENKNLTNAEQISEKAGSLIEKEFINIGKVKNISIKVLKIKNLTTKVTSSCLRIEYEVYLLGEKVSVLDSDEIDGLTQSMNNMIVNIFTTKKETYTEVTFKSRTGFSVGGYFSVDKQNSKIPATKNEKVYVETKEKIFEGKVVNTDEKGNYIWKSITTSPTEELTGKWQTYIQHAYYNNSSVFLNAEDFKSLLNLFEQAKLKM